jgi:cellulose synthase/poly-beta-1,6-N-acetylglucosamine synthase-like glycosyltransferase
LFGAVDDTVLAAVRPALATLGAFFVCAAIWPKPGARSRVLMIAVSLAFMAQYAFWRITQTLPAPAYTFEYALALSFLVAEMGGLLAAALSLLFLARTRDRSGDADANAEWLAHHATSPLIDVLICSYNEERAILERTIVGALAMDHPNFRVWMLDDSRRDWLKALCAELGCRYLSRPDNAHAKAGNINHALRRLAALPEPAEFVSILDADFVPTPQFLKRAMGLFRDPVVGVVQTPQHFVNPDPIQINLGATKFWPDEQRYFFDIVLPAKDAWSAAFCCGTSSIIRMRPLIEIGGFPTDSVTEDYLLSLRLKEKGFSTAYLNEPLTYGLAPEGLKEYITQRSRWCLGFMQIARGRSGPFSTRSTLAFFDRLSLIEVFLNWTAVYISRAIGLVIPPLSLAFNLHPFQASLPDLAGRFLPFWLWSGLTMHWLSGGRVVPILSDVSQIIVMPQILKAVAFGLVRPQGQKFAVTAKGGDRNRGFVEWRVLRPFVCLIALSMIAVLSAFYVKNGADDIRYSSPALAWTWYNLIVLVVLCFVCIERPRKRAAERYASRESVSIRMSRGAQLMQLADLSITGARIFGAAPCALGETVELELANLRLSATIVRCEADAFAVAFNHSLKSRIAMIQCFYSGGHLRPLGSIRALRVAESVVRRVFD